MTLSIRPQAAWPSFLTSRTPTPAAAPASPRLTAWKPYMADWALFQWRGASPAAEPPARPMGPTPVMNPWEVKVHTLKTNHNPVTPPPSGGKIYFRNAGFGKTGSYWTYPKGQVPKGHHWHADLSTNDFSQYSRANVHPGRATIIDAPGRPGKKAVRIEVHPGDKGSEREKSRPHTHATLAAGPGEIPGNEAKYKMSVMFPDEWQPGHEGNWNIIASWHTQKLSYNPSHLNFSIDMKSDPPMLRMTHKLRDEDGRKGVRYTSFPIAPLEKNKWYDLELNVRWAEDQTGYLELLCNGQVVVPKFHVPTFLPGDTGATFYHGMYRGEDETSTAIIFSDVSRTEIS